MIGIKLINIDKASKLLKHSRICRAVVVLNIIEVVCIKQKIFIKSKIVGFSVSQEKLESRKVLIEKGSGLKRSIISCEPTERIFTKSRMSA